MATVAYVKCTFTVCACVCVCVCVLLAQCEAFDAQMGLKEMQDNSAGYRGVEGVILVWNLISVLVSESCCAVLSQAAASLLCDLHRSE